MDHWKAIVDVVVDDAFRNFPNINKNTPTYKDRVLNTFILQHTKDILFVRKLKFVQMKLGLIWQKLAGHVIGINDLGNGHTTGLDLLSNDKFNKTPFIMELKNAFNTDNKSSRDQNLHKLVSFASRNPEYQPIYAYINDITEDGVDKVIKKNNVKIRILSGNHLLKFLFEDDYENIQTLLHDKLEMYLSKF